MAVYARIGGKTVPARVSEASPKSIAIISRAIVKIFRVNISAYRVVSYLRYDTRGTDIEIQLFHGCKEIRLKLCV